jgi:DNA (cytosine-5)-methyltransferase 1
MMLRVLDLFSGIGGFSLGLERTGGFKTVAFCEIEPFPRKVLAKHWPEVPCYHDVRALTAGRLAADGIGIDVICGGFPCQDISVAGKGAGLAGERSGLWSEYARLIGEIRPRYAIVENVSALLSRGLADVLGDLAALGYDAEWHCIPASAVGAPHRRDRIWIVAYPRSEQYEGDSSEDKRETAEKFLIAHAFGGKLRHESGRRNGAGWAGEAIASDDGTQGIVGHPISKRLEGCFSSRDLELQGETQSSGPVRVPSAILADTASNGWAEGCEDSNTLCASERGNGVSQLSGGCSEMADAARQLLNWSGEAGPRRGRQFANSGWWLAEPNVGRVAHGVPARVDRLKGLGNAVVPQIPELIGHAILAAGT